MLLLHSGLDLQDWRKSLRQRLRDLGKIDWQAAIANTLNEVFFESKKFGLASSTPGGIKQIGCNDSPGLLDSKQVFS
jgi:hypothetical protein